MARLLLASAASAAVLAAGPKIGNDQVSAEFGDRGLMSLRDGEILGAYRFTGDHFAVTIDGKRYDSATLPTPKRIEGDRRIDFEYRAGGFTITVVYETRPGWRFVSKQIVIENPAMVKFKVDEIVLFRAAMGETPKEVYTISRAKANLGTGDYGACLRFGSRGLLVTAQNPFLAFAREEREFTLGYRPEMEWEPRVGAFQSDFGLLAPYELTGDTVPEKMRPEWQLEPVDAKAGMDTAEVDAFTALVRAFLLYKPTHPLNLMVGWCVNDYQIDIATAEGRAEYKRILDMSAELGAEHVLFAPANSEVARRSMSRDDWKWEYVLWLGLGQKIRRNEWDPETGEIPASVKEMLDYAKAKNLGLLAYVYPVLGFEQSRDWLVTVRGQQRANLGFYEFQAFLIETLEKFYRRTGITGYSFDHTFLNYEGTSRYAQWWGWRRVMETLRRDIPEIVIDGRQAYQNYGPWSWLAGSYPHPTATDEQPESFNSFPDLKLDRVSADRERYTAYWYRNYEFAPSEIVPGFITHQTARNDDTGNMPSRTTSADEVVLPFRQRDWDYLGWRYSLLSSIAVAGWNNVLDMIPARDRAEFANFSAEDRNWFRYWIDWTDANKEYLRRARPFLGHPAIGRVDGIAAVVRDSGYVFLFNPNGRRMAPSFQLNDTIGLEARRGRYLVRELYPLKDRLIGKPGTGIWSYGDAISREMDGGSALVLQIVPAEEADEVALYNAPGTVRVDGTTVRLSGVVGEAGTTEVLQIAAPRASKITAVEIGGATIPVTATRSGLIELPVTFDGARFRHYQQVDAYRKDFTGGTVSQTFRAPKRVFEQLAARRKAWPIPWTEEDLRSTWLAPERLLLFVQFAEPDDRWTVSLKIDGQAVELKKAYASVRVNRRNFVGFYADVSGLAPDVEHRLELETPTGLKAGQFQGVFFENVETEYTRGIFLDAEAQRRGEGR
jgi:hypothetical protein